jgi:hypothetical protein
LSDILAQGEGCPARMLQQQRVFRDSRTSPRWRTGWSPTGPCSTGSTAIEPQGRVDRESPRELMELLTLGMGNYTGRAVNPGIRI